MRWHNAERVPKLAELTAAGPALVHFFDFAQLNSVRSLPYPIAWDERYRPAGLTTLGIHSPRFKFTGERAALAPALDRLDVSHPVADDSSYEIWNDYGCKGWPSVFLWGQGGALAWFHFGEGEYVATEAAIVEELVAIDPGFEPPPPLEPVRATDAPGALVAPPSAEVFPAGSPTDPWHSDSEPLELEYEAGGAHASVDGEGELRVSIDGGERRAVEIAAPGLYELATHARHERHTLRLETGGKLELYSVSFAPGLP